MLDMLRHKGGGMGSGHVNGGINEWWWDNDHIKGIKEGGG